MHPQVNHFTEFIKSILSEYFVDKTVLDVGSGDINGNNRYLFENCHYEGNDVIDVKNVTIVSKTKDLPFPGGHFDTIISTECFEHDPEYRESFIKIYDMLKPNGLFLFTCASSGRPEHGTRRTTPSESFGTIGEIEDMVDYYKNLTKEDLDEVLNLNQLFSTWNTYYSSKVCDLYFVGIKKGPKEFSTLGEYKNEDVINTTNITVNIDRFIENIVERKLSDYKPVSIQQPDGSSKKLTTNEVIQILMHQQKQIENLSQSSI